jgi:pyruvate formate lyase activating enzyme
MQAYFDEDLKPSRILEDFYELKVYGCNYKCIHCTTKEFQEFRSEQLHELSDLKNKILEIKPIGILISGGEPLLQRQSLLQILGFCKKKDIKTAIFTNATKPNELKSLLRAELIDKIIIDIKSSKKDFAKITKSGTFFKSADEVYSEFLESLKIIHKFSKKIDVQFISEVVPGYFYRKEDFLEIAELIKDIHCVWRIQKFIPDKEFLFRNINPVSDSFIENLKKIIQEEYPQINLEVFVE